jgi:transcriptional regulator with XRE-family HTH domain
MAAHRQGRTAATTEIAPARRFLPLVSTLRSESPVPSLKDIIRTARLEQYGMTQVEFAAAIGVSEGTLASIEYGGRPTQPVVEKLARFLQRPVAELDPDGAALKRRASPSRSQPVVADPESQLLDRLIMAHAEFNLVHADMVAAVRQRDVFGLIAARRRQAAIVATQNDVVDAFIAARRAASIPAEQPPASDEVA